ncbi:hypothetical protein [Candidatus Palauibacter sp.]|uniref:hypothetical protein n=1 Tax=Candidatus Palauibacter sp. TaxID=3101350 RepID=UPI003AF2BFD6
MPSHSRDSDRETARDADSGDARDADLDPDLDAEHDLEPRDLGVFEWGPEVSRPDSRI